MILRGIIPRSLTRAGLLAVAGLGVFLLPFVPGMAQQAPEKSATEKAIEFLNQAQQQQGQSQLAQRDLEKAKAIQQNADQAYRELEEKRMRLEMQLKELSLAIQRLQTQGGKNETAKPQAAQKAPEAGIAVGPGGAKVQPGYPAGMGLAYQPVPMGGKPAGVEQRLEQVERKLDALLWEITNLRRDMTKGHQGQGPGAGMMPPGFGAVGGFGGPGGAGTSGLPGGAPGVSPGKASGPMGGTGPRFTPAPGPSAQPGGGPSGDNLPRNFTPPSQSDPSVPPTGN